MRFLIPAVMLAAVMVEAHGAGTNAAVSPVVPGAADAAGSLFRLLGALLMVLALFFAGVWLFRNWQRVLVKSGRAPKLQVLESRGLAPRQSLHIVSVEEERFLIASSPAGIALLTRLSDATQAGTESGAPVASGFSATLQSILQRQA